MSKLQEKQVDHPGNRLKTEHQKHTKKPVQQSNFNSLTTPREKEETFFKLVQVQCSNIGCLCSLESVNQ